MGDGKRKKFAAVCDKMTGVVQFPSSNLESADEECKQAFPNPTVYAILTDHGAEHYKKKTKHWRVKFRVPKGAELEVLQIFEDTKGEVDITNQVEDWLNPPAYESIKVRFTTAK